MNKEEIYQKLEDRMLKYKDLKTVKVKENSESMILIENNNYLKTRQIDTRMKSFTGEDIYVRESVVERLVKASLLLQELLPRHKLEVVYGYRALSIQIELFEKFKKEMDKGQPKDQLLEEIHRFIAVPQVSGHPTGGAVDVQIINENDIPIDFGTKIWEFCKDSYSFSPFIIESEKHNRDILTKIMKAVGFAPFDGEWWHYSYGDKEWAKYYEKDWAIYNQIVFKCL